MKRLATLGIIACVALVVGSTAVIGAPPGPSEGIGVNVIGPDPLPISGNVDATVTNTPDVNVVNTSPVPVAISEGPTPFQFRGGMGVNYTVPEGMVVQIDYLYWWCGVDDIATTTVVRAGFNCTVDGVIYEYYFPPGATVDVGTTDAYMFSSPMKVFAEGGESSSTQYINFTQYLICAGSCDYVCTYYISGYLFPMSD